MSSEFGRRTAWRQVGPFRVSTELFLDVIFTSACDCACPWCIARTLEYAWEDRAAWEKGLRDAFGMFDIRSAIILGGEAAVDPAFGEKLAALEKVISDHPVEHLILTTNGNRFRDPAFLERVLSSRIDAVNLSRMHHDQAANDAIFGRPTLTREEIAALHSRLKAAGKTLRLNVNVWRGNLDGAEALERYVETFAGCCDAVKFTPLMETSMFGTVPEVTACAAALAMPEGEIAALWNAFAARHKVLRRASGVLGFVDYAELDVFGQRVILKYAQVEDKYDPDTTIPTLKLYPNGCLSNTWSFTRDIRERLQAEEAGTRR